MLCMVIAILISDGLYSCLISISAIKEVYPSLGVVSLSTHVHIFTFDFLSIMAAKNAGIVL